MADASRLRWLLAPHVGGSREALSQTIPSLYKQGFRTFQIFLSSPRNMNPPTAETCALIKAIPEDAHLIAHGSYLVNLLGKSKMWSTSLQYVVSSMETCDRMDIPEFVCHCGAFSLERSESRETAWSSIVEFCEKVKIMTQGLNVKLCLENDAGSKAGTKCGNVPFLYKLVKQMGSENIGMCLDTEHAFAHGWDMEDLDQVRKAMDLASVVHLNAIPDEVEQGSHLDRHSETRIRDSRYASLVLDWVKIALDLEKPMVFERSDINIYADDIKFIFESHRDWIKERFRMVAS